MKNKIPYLAPCLLIAASMSGQANEIPRPLTVCTTGDYPPLTSYNPEKRVFEGFAITVANHFAKDRKVPIELNFYKTRWKDLSADLMSGKCDIAMGGITKTEARGELFYLSEEVLENRKAAVFTQYNEDNYKSIENIDSSENLILENKGGTNEKFARKIIKHAPIKIIESNLAVFDCFKVHPKNPYIMFTDRIEIEYRTHLKDSNLSGKGIAIALPENETTSKVYMTNKTDDGKQLMSEMNAYIAGHKKEMAVWYQELLNHEFYEEKGVCPF